MSDYRGRFAPSPSGPLHRGSLATALASYLDARVAGGQWLLRIEDIDEPRTVAGAEDIIKQQLLALDMRWDEDAVRQTDRLEIYESFMTRLAGQNLVYDCYSTRSERQGYYLHPVSQERVYPGTWRDREAPPDAAQRRFSVRLKVDPGVIEWHDRVLGAQRQDVSEEVGDFVVRRADGLFAYQFVVVIDDALQNITHIVRGQDLGGSTARQIVLARRLGFAVPSYLHVPLVLDEEGRKLSKQNHAPAVDIQNPLQALEMAWSDLGFLPLRAASLPEFWRQAMTKWENRFAL